MDWKQFSASVISSLAWPIALVAVVLIFRERLENLLKQVKKIGAGGVNLELSEQVAAVRDAGEVVEAEQNVPPPDINSLDPTIVQLAKAYPDVALVQVFKELEKTILEIRSCLPDNKPHRTLTEVLKAL